MQKRITVKIGNIFSVDVDNQYKRYFQFVCRDLTILNSDVIRSFITRYPKDFEPDIDTIVSDEVDFYAHTSVSAGVKMNLWHKVGNSRNLGENSLKDVIFASLIPSFCNGVIDNKSVWRLSRVNDKMWSPDPNQIDGRKLELGDVMAPHNIVGRLKHGYYNITASEYDIIIRRPYPYVSSYTHQEIGDYIIYFHFEGEAIYDLYAENRQSTQLIESKLEIEKIFPKIRNLKFGDINWLHGDFISKEEYENARHGNLSNWDDPSEF